MPVVAVSFRSRAATAHANDEDEPGERAGSRLSAAEYVLAAHRWLSSTTAPRDERDDPADCEDA